MSKSYVVIQQYVWANEGGHGIEYCSDLIHYDNRADAISHGFQLAESDDFNIGVIESGNLVSFDWMDKPVGESEGTLAQIAELIGLEDSDALMPKQEPSA
ncbi:TPA: antitoxin [Klebsiella aerogenes]|nr:antitoxin [Klebsiella aerogenes]HBV9679817.1 antitoxin [Klebsiella aerogenes]